MRRRFLVLVVFLAALLVSASPVAANSKPTTGDRINLFSPPATFTVGAPFYIEHGFLCDTTQGDKVSNCMNASTNFNLYVDGVLQPSTVDIDSSPTSYLKRNLTNFPAGLPAGSHEFVGAFVFNGTPDITITATITFS